MTKVFWLDQEVGTNDGGNAERRRYGVVNIGATQLKNIILAAENNQKIYNSNIFMGSELLDSHRVVTVIIGKQKKYKEKIFGNKSYEKSYWPV